MGALLACNREPSYAEVPCTQRRDFDDTGPRTTCEVCNTTCINVTARRKVHENVGTQHLLG